MVEVPFRNSRELFQRRLQILHNAGSQRILPLETLIAQPEEIKTHLVVLEQLVIAKRAEALAFLPLVTVFSMIASHKVNTRSTSLVPGRFVATSKKLRFLSVSGGTKMGWNSVIRVQLQSGGIYLELSRKAGNGFYSTPDPLLIEATIDTLTRMAKRQLVGLNADATSRHIPQDVRNAVWQCDQGKCVQCGVGGPGAYLQFDHIIPYRKGGASTIGNVQLLCRNCNLKKSDRI